MQIKPLTKLNIHLWQKTLQKAGIEGTYLNIIKAIYDKPTENIILEAIAPFIQVVIVLVLVWLWGVQGAQSSSFGTTSFIIKHQQRVIGWGSGVTISCLQVLQKEDNRIFYWEELHTCHLKQNTFSWWIKQNAHNTQQCNHPAETPTK